MMVRHDWITPTLNFVKYLPVSTDPCGKIQYSIPNDNTEQQLFKLDLKNE